MDDLGPRGIASGALTLLFTDIEGSTSLWVDHPAEAGAAVSLHDEIISGAIARHDGKVIKTTGDGFLAVFVAPRAGVEAAVDAQLGLEKRADDLLNAAHVRMALHSGTVEERKGDLFGLAVNKCQRLMSAASAGQILLSGSAATVLRDDLPPESELVDLGDHRLRGIPGVERVYQFVHARLRRQFPTLATAVGVPHNLPIELTSFIGREVELAEILELMQEHRLVTLTGEGGAGKTRLALEAGSAQLDRFSDGVWLVELESIRDPDLVAERIASTLGLEERVGRAYDELVAHHLQDKHALLIVDNCEHVLDACARIVEGLLRRLPDLYVLATSRQRLGVPSEVSYRVPSMSVPDGDADFDRIIEHDSIRLFVDRARLTQPAFSISPANAGAVRRISHRLDGIPLAIELAAAKVAVLTPDQIADHLDDRFRLLSEGTRTALPRHQTLEAAIDWSYELLPQNERKLLARLAVFRGGFDLAAVESIGAAEGTGGVVTMVAALVDKSLVVADMEVARYRLLETVRQYASDRLAEEGATETAAARHAAYFGDLAESAGPGLDGPDQASWLARLEIERDNLRAALEWSLDDGRLALRLAASIWKFWLLRRRPAEGREWLNRALAIDSGGSDEWRIEALLGSGALASNQGDQETAQALLASAKRLAEAVDDKRAVAAALAATAVIHHKEGDLPAATAAFRDALDIARDAHDALVTTRILTNLSLLLEDQGEHQEAGRYAREALAVSRTTGIPDLIADAMLTAGEIALNQGDGDEARTLLEEALASGTEIGLDDITAWARSYLGKLALRAGDLQAARALLGEALEMFRDMESPMGAEWALRHLAIAELRSDEIESARVSVDEALRLASKYVRPDTPYVLQVFGEIAAEAGEFESAAVALAAARHLGTEMELRSPPLEAEALAATWGRIASEVSPTTLSEVTSRSESMSLDDAVEFARSTLAL